MTNQTYDTIKLVALIAAPVLTFAAALVSIWDVPYVDKITATLAALDALIGAVVVVLKSLYEKKQGENEGNE